MGANAAISAMKQKAMTAPVLLPRNERYAMPEHSSTKVSLSGQGIPPRVQSSSSRALASDWAGSWCAGRSAGSGAADCSVGAAARGAQPRRPPGASPRETIVHGMARRRPARGG